MIATLLSALIGFIAGVASASALPPRTFWNTFGPLLVALVEAVSAEISARQTYEQTPLDRGWQNGPKGQARRVLINAQGKTLATLRKLEGGE